MRYLGIDYGSKRVGLALSDEGGHMGFPRGILPNSGALVEQVVKLVETEGVGAIVLGESRDFAGNHNSIAEDARAFGAALKAKTGLPVYYESEVLTSAEARRAPQNSNGSRRPKVERAVDDSAAALILTSYLSRTHG
jgi:putative Holliday junction resolvase